MMRMYPSSRFRKIIPLLMGLIFGWSLLPGARAHEAEHNGHDHAGIEEVVASAQHFVDALRPELRPKATFEFNSEERLNWHFIPREREGVTLKEMSLEERRAAHHLLRSVLSQGGYLKATSVMSLEAVLRELEGPGAEERRDPEKYHFSVFGVPSVENPWGFRVEGHHLSLNFSSVGGLIVSSAPMFFGANPGEVLSGPSTGLRVLAAEEDLARQLVMSLNDQQRQKAVIAEEAPRDIITVPGNEIDLGRPAGLTASDMTDQQARMLHDLIVLYAQNLRGELAHRELDGLNDENFKQIHFAWAGGIERGQGHYYRVHAPSFIIEYDNTQNNANHIHAVWHSMNNDFGLDTLRKHYQEHDHE